jgi:hypothetical protein
MIRHARSHAPQIGAWVDVDGSAFHTNARLEHCCPPGSCEKKRAPRLVRTAIDDVNGKRHADSAEDPDEVEQTHQKKDGTDRGVHWGKTPTGRDRRYRYYEINGHLYRSADRTAGFSCWGDGGQRVVWHGGNKLTLSDRFTGAPVAYLTIRAAEREYRGYPELYERGRQALGGDPQGVSGDRGFSINLVFEHNTRRGVASVFPWRKHGAVSEREQLDTERYDRHGVPRCQHCGGPGDTNSPALGLYTDRHGEPRLRFRCMLGLTKECGRVQSIKCSENWRLLVPLSRLSETYHQLGRGGKQSERVHSIVRTRYSAAGKDQTGRLKRFGLEAQQLRLNASLVLDWFRILLLNGWAGSYKHVNSNTPRDCDGGHRLRATQRARERHHLNRPYGPVAHRLGLVKTPLLPGKAPPDNHPPPELPPAVDEAPF